VFLVVGIGFGFGYRFGLGFGLILVLVLELSLELVLVLVLVFVFFFFFLLNGIGRRSRLCEVGYGPGGWRSWESFQKEFPVCDIMLFI
jgi:hypothetical protein